MTKKKSTRKPVTYTRAHAPVRPVWMRVIKFITLVIFTALTLLSIVAAVMHYYKHVIKN